MALKAITLQRRLANAVEAAAHEHAELVASAHQRRMALAGVTTPTTEPTGEPGTASALSLVSEPPDLLAIQRHAGEMIAFFRERLTAAERAHAEELETDLTPRTDRDEAAAATFERLREVRRIVEVGLGPKAVVQVLGLSGETPTDPAVLLEHAARAVERLTARAPGLPPVRVSGVAVDWVELAGYLAERTEDLHQALTTVTLEQKRANRFLKARQEAFQDFRDVYVGYTKVLEGYYIAAGRRDLVDNLRLTLPIRAVNDDVLDEPPVEEPPAEVPPVEPPVEEPPVGPPVAAPPVQPPVEAPPAQPPAQVPPAPAGTALQVGTVGEEPANEPGAKPGPAPLALPGGAA